MSDICYDRIGEEKGGYDRIGEDMIRYDRIWDI